MPLAAVAIALVLHALVGLSLWGMGQIAPRTPPVEEAIEANARAPEWIDIEGPHSHILQLSNMGQRARAEHRWRPLAKPVWRLAKMTWARIFLISRGARGLDGSGDPDQFFRAFGRCVRRHRRAFRVGGDRSDRESLHEPEVDGPALES